jgi:hypothetical protein
VILSRHDSFAVAVRDLGDLAYETPIDDELRRYCRKKYAIRGRSGKRYALCRHRLIPESNCFAHFKYRYQAHSPFRKIVHDIAALLYLHLLNSSEAKTGGRRECGG